MDNEIDPAIGSWYRHVDDGRLFQVVALDDEQELVEFQHFDGAIEEVGFDEWHSWDLEITDAPEDWTGPVDRIGRGDLGYTDVRSEGETRAATERRRQEALQDPGTPGSKGTSAGERPASDEASDIAGATRHRKGS